MADFYSIFNFNPFVRANTFATEKDVNSQTLETEGINASSNVAYTDGTIEGETSGAMGTVDGSTSGNGILNFVLIPSFQDMNPQRFFTGTELSTRRGSGSGVFTHGKTLNLSDKVFQSGEILKHSRGGRLTVVSKAHIFSEEITITGLDESTTISTDSSIGSLIINGGDEVSSGTVTNNDTLQLKMFEGYLLNTTNFMYLTISDSNQSNEITWTVIINNGELGKDPLDRKTFEIEKISVPTIPKQNVSQFDYKSMSKILGEKKIEEKELIVKEEGYDRTFDSTIRI